MDAIALITRVTPGLKIGEKSLRFSKHIGDFADMRGHCRIAYAGAVLGALRDPFWGAYAIRDLATHIGGWAESDSVDRFDNGILILFRLRFLVSILFRGIRKLRPHPHLDLALAKLRATVPHFAMYLTASGAIGRVEKLSSGNFEKKDGWQLACEVTDMISNFSEQAGFDLPAAATGGVSALTGIWANVLVLRA